MNGRGGIEAPQPAERDELALAPAELGRLYRLIERRLPHLLNEPERIDWYVAEVLSYWKGRAGGGKTRRDWPLTVLNRMLRLEAQRPGGIPDPARVRNEQAERRLAAAAARNAERGDPLLRAAGPLGTGHRPLRLPREVE